jgi:UDP-2,3-diacylglucosamine pyrophosphatase LpxH
MNAVQGRARTAKDLRAIWISDLHIGTRESKVDLLIDFLSRNSCDVMYLIGDIVDLRHISQRQRWNRSQEKALHTLIGLASTTHVVVLPGNHDRILRTLPPLQGGNISFHHEHIHTTATGRRLLVTHGDAMDERIRRDVPSWHIDVACHLYYSALALEHWVNVRRIRRGQPLRRYVGSAKARLASWRAYRDSFVEAIVAEAAAAGVDGVVCGHIHAPNIEERGPILYANCGDWVENCTAVVETHDGEMRLVRWDRRGLAPVAQAPAVNGQMSAVRANHDSQV